MSVTESNLPVGDTEEKLDTTKVTQTDGSIVHREAVVVTDPETLAGRAAVNKAAGPDQYGAVTRDARMPELLSMLDEILGEIRVSNLHLALITDTDIEPGDGD